ncbi:hypothetical protein RESH_02930 [Rhodopirellula europaea SH398]|jgi:hypothetical protein|uniref:Uncharacterized protein n=1 Tax=Rhodopirellula europaea SH398 TaxID=1263868 RepID=M5S4J4_9BACT|nr:hypothetical protein RESH_02930 [Rhodopirellula europaea SH398]
MLAFESFIPKGLQTVAGGLNAVNTTGFMLPTIPDPERVEDSGNLSRSA